jgi:hypothetical protein
MNIHSLVTQRFEFNSLHCIKSNNFNPPETQENSPCLIMVNRRAEEGVSHGREQLVVIQIDSDSDEGE